MTNKKFKLAAMSLATAVAVSTVGPSASAVTYYLGDGSVTVDRKVVVKQQADPLSTVFCIGTRFTGKEIAKSFYFCLIFLSNVLS